MNNVLTALCSIRVRNSPRVFTLLDEAVRLSLGS